MKSSNLTGNSLRELGTVEFLLTIDSQIGPTNGGGWHGENSTVQLVAPDYVPASGILGLLGGQYVLVRWVGSDGETIADTVVMDAPRTVTPVYVLAFPEQALFGVIGGSVIVVLSAIVFARKKLS